MNNHLPFTISSENMAGNYSIFYISQEPLYTKEELLAINDTIQNSNTTKPEPEKFGASQANKQSKVSLILWLELKKQLEKMENFIYDVNDEFFHYDIFDISDFHYLNINEYDEENNSYDWHVDCNTYGSEEDLKLTCLLNISTELYDGGRLCLHGLDEEDEERLLKEFAPGHALLFTSYRQHKVEPVTSGKRKTLSYWVRGPAWK
jgi:PKHD-type hydroxylase|tara:strand:- start:259 stop:873 length:615 start_codon:yes stop_codon:yes gene_type:complete